MSESQLRQNQKASPPEKNLRKFAIASLVREQLLSTALGMLLADIGLNWGSEQDYYRRWDDEGKCSSDPWLHQLVWSFVDWNGGIASNSSIIWKKRRAHLYNGQLYTILY